MTYEQCKHYLDPFPLNQVSEIAKENLCFSDEVRQICESNGCGRYGKTWMCPPGVGAVADWKERIMAYRHAVLFNYVDRIEDSFDFEGMMKIGHDFSAIIRKVKNDLERDGADFLIFGAGSCQLCQTCTYPDAPCRRPNEAIPSVEACGLYVAKMAEPCGFRYINGQNTVTYFGLIMFH